MNDTDKHIKAPFQLIDKCHDLEYDFDIVTAPCTDGRQNEMFHLNCLAALLIVIERRHNGSGKLISMN
jgi:hypothetical protein